MAGEATSRSLVTLAFQKKRDLEWCKLRKHLHTQLQKDIARIYDNSLYCDLELRFDSSTVKAHRSILEVRAAKFYSHLNTHERFKSNHKNVHSVGFKRASAEYIKCFVRNIYGKCAVEEEESDIVHYLQKLREPTDSRYDDIKVERDGSYDSVLSPESDIYLTPNCSPSDFYSDFIRDQSQDTSIETTDPLSTLHKTNRSYYTIVAVDEVYKEENQLHTLKTEATFHDVLEKELAEQDELLKSFRSIKSKEEKKTNIPTKKINKPTSLPVSSSQYTKKQKRGCDFVIGKEQNRKERGLVSALKQLPSSSGFNDRVEPKICVNSKENNTEGNAQGSFLKRDKIRLDKFDLQEVAIKEEEESTLLLKSPYCSCSCDGNNCKLKKGLEKYTSEDGDEFFCSLGGGMDCGVECCKKDIAIDDLSTFTPCSPEMDASGGGPDSGLDTCSTGCIPGGGFSSPREHTVSETSGVDLTEAAIGEDMPHDGDSEPVLQKHDKSSVSSSVSSEAGTWDSTFPPVNGQEQDADTKPKQSTDMQGDVTGVETKYVTKISKQDKDVPLQEDTKNPTNGDAVSKTFTPICNVQNPDAIPDNTVKINSAPIEQIKENQDRRVYEFDDSFDISTNEALHGSINSEVFTDPCESGTVKQKRKASSLVDLQSEYLVDSHELNSGEKCKEWKIDTTAASSNNYFINAASLVDDNELPTSLPPLYIHETESKMKQSTDQMSVNKIQPANFVEDPSMRTPTSSPTEVQNVSSVTELNVSNPVLFPLSERTQSTPTSTNAEDCGSICSREPVKNDAACTDGNTEEPSVMRVTFLKMGGTRHEVKMLNGQDLFAEFQKEIRLTEHLEPQVSRKLTSGRTRWDSLSEDSLTKHQSVDKKLSYDNSVAVNDVHEKHETEAVVEETSLHTKDGGGEEIPSDSTQCKLQQIEESKTSEEPGQEENETDGPRRPSLIRRKTFELDPDDEHLALLRQEYERRQGNLLFQNCIPQFSGHITGSEGFRDAQSLLVIGTDCGPVVNDQEVSLPSMSVADSMGPITAMETDTTHLPHTVPIAINKTADHPLSDLIFIEQDPLINTESNISPTHANNQNCVDREMNSTSIEVEQCDTRYDSTGKVVRESLSQPESNDYLDEREHTVPKRPLSSSYDITCKPVISGALTCSDLGIEDKRLWDSPKKQQKRTESTPIVSGGVSTVDFSIHVRKVSESPIMRRKNEAAPILSGAAPVSPHSKETLPEIRPPCISSSAAWVVDMSDCASSSTKPSLDSRKHRKSDSTSGISAILQSTDLNDKIVAPLPIRSDTKNTSLGYFIDLTEASIEKQPTEKKDVHSMYNQKSLQSTPVNIGYFVGFDEVKSHSGDKWDKKSSSFEEKRELIRQASKSEDAKSSGKNSPCGFFIDLTSKDRSSSAPKDLENRRQLSEEEKETSTGDKKNAIFSMFIDIGSTMSDTAGRHGSAESVKSKVGSSPLLSTYKKLGHRRSSLTRVEGVDRTSRVNSGTFDADDDHPTGEVSKGTCMYINANAASSKSDSVSQLNQPSSLEEVNERKDSKKQSFFMFIENESPVIRRKTLQSGLRPTSNRHSWNPETRTTVQTEEQRISSRKQHKRAHSVSVDRSSLSNSVDEHKSSSSSSLTKVRQQGSSHSLCDPSATPDIGMPQMSVSCHARLSSKANDRFVQQSLSVEENAEDEMDVKLIQEKEKNLGQKISVSGNVDIKYSVKEANVNVVELSHFETTEDINCTQTHTVPVFESSDGTSVSTENKGAGSHQIEKKQENVENAVGLQRDINSFEKPAQVSHKQGKEKCVQLPINSDADRYYRRDKGFKKDVNPTNNEMHHQTTEIQKSDNFVKLSDLDKETSRTQEPGDGSNILPSFSATNRMTRSIPETSWIENKLLMSRSIGSGSTSKSLSRLFPHLHTASSVSGSPSNINHSKSPGGQFDGDDNDMQVSETSDLSSMQSSMGPSGLEGSTEETDASSSYAGRSGPVSRLGEDLLRMFLEEINPDVTVEVGGRRLKAHKCILSSRCQYFAAMLSGGWVESAGNVISLQGFSYNAVHFALCHIYSGTSNIPDTISIVELATLADMLGLEGLKEVIMYTLKVKYCHFFHKPCTMCTVGVLECLPLAAAYGLDEIYRKSLRWITKYFVRIWPTKGFASLPRELIEKCYQQHVVHMSVDNVLETVMCCDKLLATLPNVRWAEPVFGITSQLLEASIKYIANNFCGVLSSENFLSLGKELSWNISRLEDSIMAATDRLPPDQACQSFSRLYQILTVVRSSDPPPEMQWSQNFIELLSRIQKRVESSLVRQAPRAARCHSWTQMEPELRRKIQEIACLVLVPGEDGHRSRLANLSKRGSSGGSSAYCTGPRPVSTTGLRSLDLRQVRLAMTQQARRAASGGRVSTLKADTKAKTQGKQVPPPQVKKDVTTTDESSKASNGETTGRPKTWPMRVLEPKSRPTKYKTNSSTSSTGTPEKSGSSAPRRSGKTMISSSDSSRTSSPAMRRSALSNDNSTRARAATIGSTPSRNLTNRSDTPPGRELRNRRKRDGEITTMSTDSLIESPSNGSTKRVAKELTESTAGKSCMSTRPDTPSVKRKVREEAMSADSLSSITNGERSSKGGGASSQNQSALPPKPETPKDKTRNVLGKLGPEIAVSTDSLATDSSYAEHSIGSKVEDGKATKALGGTGREHKSSGAGKVVKANSTRSEVQRSPAPAVRKLARQSVSSPRDSPTARLRSAVSSSPYTESPCLRRSLLLASKPPGDQPAVCSSSSISKQAVPTKATTVIKSEKLTAKLVSSPSTSISSSKRTPTRIHTRSQMVPSPAKAVLEGTKACTTKHTFKDNTLSATKSSLNTKTTNGAKNPSNGNIADGRNKRNCDSGTRIKTTFSSKRSEAEDKPPSVGSRSGTFLKDEPTVLKKPDIDNVQE